jgi:redox-sensitive bicupin YhaK (pirin superfamily)
VLVFGKSLRSPAASKRGRLQLIVSPDGRGGSLGVYQNALIYSDFFDGDECATLHFAAGRSSYVHMARGQARVNGVTLDAGDGARVREERALKVEAGSKAEVLVFDLRARGLP